MHWKGLGNKFLKNIDIKMYQKESYYALKNVLI